MTNTNTKPATAATAYTHEHEQARRLLAALHAALRTHEAKAHAAPRDWGYAGDLGALNETLRNALDRLAGDELAAALLDEPCPEER